VTPTAEGAGDLLDLGLELGLTGAWAVASTGSQCRAAAVQELVTPGCDRGLRDPLTAGGLLDRDFAAQHRQDDAQLVIDGLDRWSCHRTPSDRPRVKFRLSQES
jgi:hypothetical protein